MKKILLAILCIFPFLGAWCQSSESEPWFYEGKQWSIFSQSDYPISESTLTSVIQGSVEIDGKTYWKVFESDKEELSDLKFSDYYLREAGSKIYRYYPSTKEEKLFMDFDLKKGDTFISEMGVDIKIIEVTDTVLPQGDGVRRKCINTGYEFNGKINETWVEGVGSLTLGIEGLFTGLVGNATLLCCHDANKSLYMNEYYNTCFRETPPPKLMVLGKQWAVWSESTAYPPDGVTQTYVIETGTTIDDNYYYRVRYSSREDLSDMKPSHYLRERAGKVYVYYERLKKEYLWFDFNLNVGDKFSFYTEEPDKDATATVVAITDTIFPHGDGVKRKCFHLEPSYCGIMVEGVGSLSHGICEFDICSTDRVGNELLCCHDADVLLYQSKTGTCYKSTGMQSNQLDGLSVVVRCLEKGKLFFSWDTTLAFNRLGIYTEDGTLFREIAITDGEKQTITFGIPKGIYFYELSSGRQKTIHGKVYVK